MDHFIDVIPNDRGEEIRKRVRERDGSESKIYPAKRWKEDTSALLTPDGDEDEVEEPLKPEEDLDKYDRGRLLKGLKYMKAAAKQRITPRTLEFLKLHKDAYKAALNEGAPVISSRAVVQAMDQVYFSAAFYLKPRSPEGHYHLMLYVKLRRLELLANYRNYLGQELYHIRADLKAAFTGASSELNEAGKTWSTSWLAIAGELARANMSDLQEQVYFACGVLGIDPNHMKWLIEKWMDRNVSHSQIRQNIFARRWSLIAEQLCRDLKELLNILPDLKTAENYERVLLIIRDEYFDVLNRDDPQHWILNENARSPIGG